MKACRNCQFFHALTEANGKGGQCRKNPPVAQLVPVQTLQGQSLAVNGLFPPVENDTFCGEFKPVLSSIN